MMLVGVAPAGPSTAGYVVEYLSAARLTVSANFADA
jgi:hypothetical protein